jgi:flagellar protein FliL
MAVEAEAEVEEGAEAQPVKRGIPRKLIIIAAAGLVVLLAAGAGLYFFVFAGRGAADAAHTASAVPATFIFNLPAMTVNLNDDGVEGDQFLKLTIALEVADETVMKEIQPRMAKVVDAFQVYLRELRKSDLEGSAGIYRLKEELRRRVNLAIFPAQVEGILFKEILVQ